jgi:hypothetical protein
MGFSEDEITARVSDQSKSATFWKQKTDSVQNVLHTFRCGLSASLPMVIGNSFICGLNP